jgi:hypothetical protein
VADRFDWYLCPETHFCGSEIVYSFLFYPEDLYMWCIHLFSGVSEFMVSEDSSPHHIERRKKSRRDIDASEGGSRNPPTRRASKRTVHRDFSRARMSINTEIEEEEEQNPMETNNDEIADDETYRMSPVPPFENNAEDDVESVESELRKKSRTRWLKGLLIPDLEERLLSTLVQSLEVHTSP